jgi:hypothetical protein
MFEVSSQMDKFGRVLIYLFLFHLAKPALCDRFSMNKNFNYQTRKGAFTYIKTSGFAARSGYELGDF